jgi:hypothetical protein
MRIDHFALAVSDLDAAARALLDEHGLDATPRHPSRSGGPSPVRAACWIGVQDERVSVRCAILTARGEVILG